MSAEKRHDFWQRQAGILYIGMMVPFCLLVSPLWLMGHAYLIVERFFTGRKK